MELIGGVGLAGLLGAPSGGTAIGKSCLQHGKAH
jgi:hypothetical protein